MPRANYIQQIAIQFAEQFQSRQSRYAPQVEESKLRLQEATLGAREAQRAQDKATTNLFKAQLTAATIPRQKQVLRNTRTILASAQQRLHTARAQGHGVANASRGVRRAHSRVAAAKKKLQEARQAKSSLPELRDFLDMKQMENIRASREKDSAQNKLTDAIKSAGLFGAAKEGLSSISQGIVRGTQRGGGLEGAGDVIQGVGALASALPGGASIGAAATFTGGLIKAVGALDRWTRSVTDSALHLGQQSWSPGMAMQQAIARFNEQINQMLRDQLRFSAAGQAAQATARFDRLVTIPVESAFGNAVDRTATTYKNAISDAVERKGSIVGGVLAGGYAAGGAINPEATVTENVVGKTAGSIIGWGPIGDMIGQTLTNFMHNLSSDSSNKKNPAQDIQQAQRPPDFPQQ